MKQVKNEDQLFYSKDGLLWEPSLCGTEWEESKCEGYLYKHLSWSGRMAIENPEKSQEQLNFEFSQKENEWVSSVISEADRQINYHVDGDTYRKTSTLTEWKAYRVALRDYVKDGVVTSETRPLSPVEVNVV